MDLYFERIQTAADLEQIKCWLEDEELLRLARMTDKPLTEEDFQAYLKTLSYLVYVDGLAIGYARIYTYAQPDEGEIGITIALPEYWKKGIGTEIGKKLIVTCLTMGMYKIHWATAIYNFPSMKLAEKLGFHFEKLLPQAIQLKTGPRDAVVYCLEV